MGKNSKDRRRQREADAEDEPLVMAVPPGAKYYCEVHDLFFRSKVAAAGDMDRICGHGGPHQCGQCLKRFTRKTELQWHQEKVVRDHNFPAPLASITWQPSWVETWRSRGVPEDVIAAFEAHFSVNAEDQHQAGGNNEEQPVRILLLRLPAGHDLSAVIPKPGRLN